MRNLEHVQHFAEQRKENDENKFQRVRHALWQGYSIQRFQIKNNKFVSPMHTCSPDDCPGVELLDLKGKTLGNCSRIINNEGKVEFCMVNLQ